MGSSDKKGTNSVTLNSNPSDASSKAADKISNTKPTEEVHGKKETPEEVKERKRTGGTSEGKKSLAESAMTNPTMLGDPVSLKAEKSNSEITKDDRGVRGVKKPHSNL